MNTPAQSRLLIPVRLQVVVDTPAHSALCGPLTYLSELPLAPGSLVRVPLGKREILGVVWDGSADTMVLPPGSVLKPVAGALAGLPALSAHWRQLVTFAANYYQRSLGEVALAALPPQLRGLSPIQLARRLKPKSVLPPVASTTATSLTKPTPTPSQQQIQALTSIANTPGPFLLFGATGSGKTEVYLQAVQTALQENANNQVLVMVPEINLTPQLLARFEARFGATAVATLHSGLTPAQRLAHWLAAHTGSARIVLGTRMAVFASMPQLRLIVVDEEHDASYKQQEGARYSARDLAIYRGWLESAKVILGSATPSLESWHASRPAADGGRYMRLLMPTRMGRAATHATGMPAQPTSAETAASGHGFAQVRLLDMKQQPPHTRLAIPLLEAIAKRIAGGEQSLVLLNRRGYAPVLACHGCGWKSQCPHCSAYRVFHKLGRTLRCHHCGFTERVPRACPGCGNPDIAMLGRGTEQLEEHLGEWLAKLRRPDGEPVHLTRIDADSTRRAGSLTAQLAQVHSGEVDVLVGTQMIAKGHDFRRVTLVACIEADSALFSSDFRAPERLFSLLMQAGGRAGRDARLTSSPEMWIQTYHPQHPLFDALKRHDYPGFAQGQLADRQAAGLPPFAYQALLRADARTQALAQHFLEAARNSGNATATQSGLAPHISIYPAVPLGMARVANVERAQLLVESPSRKALQDFLRCWQPLLQGLRHQPEGKGVIRWAVDVDPQAI